MYQFKKNLLKKPVRGWYYMELSAHGTVRLDGATVEEVETKIYNFRVTNGIQIGDPHVDMIKFWYAKNPEFFEHGNDSESRYGSKEIEALGDILAWLKRIGSLGPEIEIGAGVITERSAICSNCPHNISIHGYAKIRDEIDRRSFMIRHGEIMNGLSFCELHHTDLKVAVRLRKELLTQHQGQPAHCWIVP